jgi:hypothetical protein
VQSDIVQSTQFRLIEYSGNDGTTGWTWGLTERLSGFINPVAKKALLLM